MVIVWYLVPLRSDVHHNEEGSTAPTVVANATSNLLEPTISCRVESEGM